jgi:hypothetical protein
LNCSPPPKVLPKHHTTEDWKARQTKPLARSRVGDAGENSKFLRVQRLPEPALRDDFVKVYATELFILEHSLLVR